MKLILLGPPGAGKGTMAKVLSRRFGIPHLSAGDLLRTHIRDKTELGRKAASFVDNGQLVPDDLVIEMMRERLLREDASRGFILDGFPRTEGQARALDQLLQGERMMVDHVFDFDASAEKITERLSGRRICSKCQEIYHLKNMPPKIASVCDRCGGELVQRKDDAAETVQMRLEVYRQETAPLIRYYDKQKLLRRVPADLEVKDLEPILEKWVA